MVSQSRRRTWSWGIALVWLGLAFPARAADWPVARGPSREPSPYKYDPRAVRKLPKAFLDDAPACTVYSGTSHLMEADGTVETVTHEVLRFNGRKGIEKLGEYRNITYDPAYQKLTLNIARVWKPSGKCVEIAPRHVQLRDQGTDYEVYDHDKQLVISFPDLDVGDVIEVKWTARGKNPEYLGQFFTRYNFGDDRYPVAVDEMWFRLPKSRTLKYAGVNGKLEPAVRTDGHYRLYHWRVTGCRSLPQDDNLPSKEELRLQVVCSTFASWEEVGRWKEKLRADCWKCTQEIRNTVREVTRGLKAPADKARALTYWVRRHIRYLSLGATTHDYKPHPPGAVLANRFGDCKDQAQLLAVMLREAGLSVGLVTLGTRDDGQVVPEVPSPWGTHAILAVTIDGKDHWIDTTVSNAPWDYLPPDDRDRWTYITDAKGLRLKRTPALTADANRTEQTTVVTVAADGAIRVRRQLVCSGVAAVRQRGAWAEVPPGERRRLVAGDLQDSNSRARLRRLAINEKRLNDPEQAVAATLEFDIPGYFSGNPELEASFTDSKVWGKLLSITLDYDRKAPLDLGDPFESVHRYALRLPPALTFESLPGNQWVRSKWGSFRLTVLRDEKDPRLFAMGFHTRLEKTRVEPADFDAFRKFHAAVSQSWRAWISLKATADVKDAPALAVRTALAPGDAASAATLARLLCDNGHFKDARRVLAWARRWHPRNASLWELTVRAAANAAEVEEAYLEMVRLFPREEKYAVALGAVRIKRHDFWGARPVLEAVTRRAMGLVCANAHYQLARGWFDKGDLKKALGSWEEAARTDTESVNSVAAWQFKGLLYEKLGQARDAAGAYRQALKVDADAEGALYALVRLELAAGRRTQALDHLRRYTLVVNGDLQGMVKAADFHLGMGRYEDAFDLAKRGLAIRFDTKAQRILGLVYAHRGEHEKAVATLEKAEKTQETKAALIQSYVALGKVRKATGLLDDYHRKSHMVLSKELLNAWAVAVPLKCRREALAEEIRMPARKREVWEEALDALVSAEYAHEEGHPAQKVDKLLAKAFAGGVEIGPAFSFRGLLALEKGRLARALGDAEKAIKLNPKDPRAYYVRGRVRFERGTKGTLADLARAAELNKQIDEAAARVDSRKASPERYKAAIVKFSKWDEAGILHALAAALWQANRRPEALKAQREAVKLRPKDPEMLEQLKEMERSGK
jgi:tetratricopeptide (TPR) repeat protein